MSKDPSEAKEEVVSISVKECSGGWWPCESGTYLSCLGKIRRSIRMEQNEEEAWWKLWFKNHRDDQSFGFYSNGREIISILSKRVKWSELSF